MNGFDRFISFFSPKAGARRASFRALESFAKRRYEGSAKGRRTKGWKSPSTSANSEIESSITTLRNRSRQLVRDNAYAARGVQVVEANVIGKGIMGQVKVDSGQKNRTDNESAKNREKDLSQRWKAWSSAENLDMEGRLNLFSMQRLLMRSVVESGEVFVRRIATGRRSVRTPDGKVVEIPAFKLQVLESDFLDSNGIGVTPLQGNKVIQGIEFNQQNERVAYHMYLEHPGDNLSGVGMSLKTTFKTVRIPADEILHIYRIDRPGQIRGVPWLHPVMIRLKDLDEYEDAQLVRQKIAACFSVFIKDIDGVDATMTPKEGELGEKVEPGIIEFLPPGKDIELANPPGVQNYAEYTNAEKRAIATGLGITFESMTQDYSQVNFSSGRMGWIEMGRNVDMWRQDMMVSQFLNPLFGWFMDGLALLGVDTTRTRPMWTPPRREMIDPVKETEALKTQVRSGFTSFSDSIRMSGKDPENHFDELERDKEKIEELGLILDSDPSADADRLNTEQPAASTSGDE